MLTNTLTYRSSVKVAILKNLFNMFSQLDFRDIFYTIEVSGEIVTVVRCEKFIKKLCIIATFTLLK